MAVKITIIGWYGTETIGDRAILAGIFTFFKKAFGEFEVKLGSLYPFFTQRTLNEDYSFWEESCDYIFPVQIFDSKKARELDNAIKDSDLVLMGGGPLMHIEPLFMVEYALKKAKKLGKTTALLGCGVGPIFSRKFKKSLINIVNSSDLILLRDSFSKKYLEDIFDEYVATLQKKIYISFDPAVQCAKDFNRLFRQDVELDTIAVNLRDFPQEYSKDRNDIDINKKLYEFVDFLASNFPGHNISLVPMHYFHIGNDDREFLNKIRFELDKKNISVQNKPLSMVGTMKVYSHAKFNIGMRFHSVVLQTMVSGKNFVLDYTEPNKGKIAGFLNDIDQAGFYSDKYICLQSDKISTAKFSATTFEKTFSPEEDLINSKLKTYTNCLKMLL
jgi:polysaccharide pyruvyl transferase WcaK-like protein